MRESIKMLSLSWPRREKDWDLCRVKLSTTTSTPSSQREFFVESSPQAVRHYTRLGWGITTIISSVESAKLPSTSTARLVPLPA